MFRIVPAGLIVGQIGTSQIAPGAVTSAKIAAGAVNTAELAAGAVTSAQINAAAGILGTQIANGTLTGSNIAAGTITAGLLAAGIVVAGIVDGTLIQGAELVADGSSGGIFEFSAAPALGNLILSATPFTGVDPVAGNPVQRGLCSIDTTTGSIIRIDGASLSLQPAGFFQAGSINAGSGILTLTSPEMSNTDFSALLRLRSVNESLGSGAPVAELQGGLQLIEMNPAPVGVAGYVLVYADQFGQFHVPGAIQTDTNLEIQNLGSPPGAGGSGAKTYSTSGHAQHRSGQAATGGDQNSYDAESNTQIVGSPGPTINQTTFTQTVLSKAVGVGKYRVHVRGRYTENQAAGLPEFAFTGPATVANSVLLTATFNGNGAQGAGGASAMRGAAATALGTANFVNGPTMTGGTIAFDLHLEANFSAAGTLALVAASSVAADTFTITPGTDMNLAPVVAV